MIRSRNWLTIAAGLIAFGGAAYSSTAVADDMVSFATGGYASGLRTMTMMHMIDTDKDGTVSKEEWVAWQEKVFKTMDKDHKGYLEQKDFVSVDPKSIAFATAAYSRGLRTDDMFKKIDTDGDGKITRDEFVNYNMKIFDMMDVQKSGKVGAGDFITKK